MRPAVTRLAAVCVWLFACVGAVQTPHVHAAGQVATDPAELQVFLDRAVPAAMQEWHVPGTVVLAVLGDDVVLQQGYGYADLEREIRVSPESTEFRMFSLSKLFTASAVMQLVEQGRIDLDADVNTYLTQLHVENPYAQPMRIRDLLTHTAGLDGDQPKSADPLEPTRSGCRSIVIWPDGRWFRYGHLGSSLCIRTPPTTSSG